MSTKYTAVLLVNHIFGAEDVLQKIRDELKTGCEFSYLDIGHSRRICNFGITIRYYKKGMRVYALVSNDDRRKIIKYLDER